VREKEESSIQAKRGPEKDERNGPKKISILNLLSSRKKRICQPPTLSLSLYLCLSLCPLTNTHTHALLGKETQHTDTHTKPSSLYQYLRTPLYFAITYTLRISFTLSLTLSLYLSLSLSLPHSPLTSFVLQNICK